MEARIIRGPEYEAFHNRSTLAIWAAWNELIDNSIDNGATDIWIENNGTSSTIRDNGAGIKNTIKDIERVLMFHSGQNKKDEKKIGCYGLGLKEATMKLGKVISVWSKAEGYGPITFNVPWYKLTNDEKILFENGADIGIEHGTIITIFYDEEDIKNNRDMAPDRKSFKYYDKIIKGRKINIWCDDKLYSTSADIVFDDKSNPDILKNINYGGVKFDLKIGILSKRLISLSGFYIYSVETLRYYSAGDKYLDGSISASDGLYVSIGLHNTKADWRVDTNKRSVNNIDIVSKYLKEYKILDKWIQALYNGKKDDTIRQVENTINEIFGVVSRMVGQEVRDKINKNTGPIEPKSTGIKRQEAEKIREHPDRDCRLRNQKVKGYTVKDCYLEDKTRFLSVQRNNNEMIIALNRSNKRMLQLLQNKNTIAVTMLVFIAIKAELSVDMELPNGIVYEIFRENENYENIAL